MIQDNAEIGGIITFLQKIMQINGQKKKTSFFLIFMNKEVENGRLLSHILTVEQQSILKVVGIFLIEIKVLQKIQIKIQR